MGEKRFKFRRRLLLRDKTELKDTFLIEQYKYVLERRKALNEATFKIVSVYQVLELVVATGQCSVISQSTSDELNREAIIRFSEALLFGSFILSSFGIALLLGGTLAWINYRSEENELRRYADLPCKQRITICDVWRWYETYLILGMIVVPVVHAIFYYRLT